MRIGRGSSVCERGPMGLPMSDFCECNGFVGPNDICLECGKPIRPAVDETPRARNTDPIESHSAGSRVNAARDRQLVLQAFANSECSLTYREAALLVTEVEGTSQSRERTESLRRRGSDLKQRGYIIQIGSRKGQAVFLITDLGRRTVDTRHAK